VAAASSSKRRVERADVAKRLRGVYLRAAPLGTEPLRVVNISELGLGLESAGPAASLSRDQEFEGRLLVGKTNAPLRLRVVHATPEVIGMEFVEISDVLRAMIRRFFEAELSGASLKPEKPKGGGKSGSQTLEFSDGADHTLQLTVAAGQLRGLRIGLMGTSIEWATGGELRLVRNSKDEPVSEHLRAQLVKFIRSAQTLVPALRKQVESVLLVSDPDPDVKSP
jgi:hypothetical protein